MRVCEYCRHENAEDAVWCEACGTQFLVPTNLLRRFEAADRFRLRRWRAHQPVFGRLSLWVLAAAAVVTSALAAVPFFGSYGESGMGFIFLGLLIDGILCAANVVIALIGLARRESPRWLAITGLVLSALPVLGGIYLLCGAPW